MSERCAERKRVRAPLTPTAYHTTCFPRSSPLGRCDIQLPACAPLCARDRERERASERARARARARARGGERERDSACRCTCVYSDASGGEGEGEGDALNMCVRVCAHTRVGIDADPQEHTGTRRDGSRTKTCQPAAATLTMAVFPEPDGPRSKSNRCPAVLPRWRCERLSSIHSLSSLTLSLCTARSDDARGANRSAHTSLPSCMLSDSGMAGALYMPGSGCECWLPTKFAYCFQRKQP